VTEADLYHQNRSRRRLTATETDFDVARQKAVLVALDHAKRNDDIDLSLDELELLVDTAGADVVARETQKRASPDPATFIGPGKAHEIAQLVAASDADLVVFDTELSPAQQRNLESMMKVDVVDRVAVILDIFAQHATTQEGMVQVELAQLKYRLPRLRGRGLTLSQQGGGIGTRGPGETQLEVDRRNILRKMSKLERDLKKLEKVRATQRRRRRRRPEKRVAIVGYTNAGKSSLLNALAKSDAHVENRLFATLAPTTRQVYLGVGKNYIPHVILFSDTVGFVRNLPHELVEAFRSTLEEAADADLLIHLVDATSPDVEGNIASVNAVLKEIEANEVPQILVWNKIDALTPDQKAHIDDLDHDLKANERRDSFFVSAQTREGLDELRRYLNELPPLAAS
jgi:GTP-binding protein HflX